MGLPVTFKLAQLREATISQAVCVKAVSNFCTIFLFRVEHLRKDTF